MLGFSEIMNPEYIKAQKERFHKLCVTLMYQIDGPLAVKPEEILKLRRWGVITRRAYQNGME